MYLTYEEYINMGGTLEETTFNDYEFEASTVVDWYTFNRLHNETTLPDALKRLMYHLIKLLDMRAQALGISNDSTGSGGKNIVSRSNDGVSESYNVVSASDVAQLAKDEMAETVKRYLQGVTNSLGRHLLYRGVYPGE